MKIDKLLGRHIFEWTYINYISILSSTTHVTQQSHVDQERIKGKIPKGVQKFWRGALSDNQFLWCAYYENYISRNLGMRARLQ